jgi:hypothetical protein
MNVHITSEPRPEARDDGVEGAGGRRRWLRPVLRILGILMAAALMLVLLGLLFSPRYWRF